MLKHGDFTELADDYLKNRPDYSPIILKSIFGLIDKPIDMIDAADVGAGTGIWTKMLSKYNLKSIKAIEPNQQMRINGKKFLNNEKISWYEGSGEETGLLDNSTDIISMASSFHWVDFDKGVKEFCRVLRSKGLFVALWNPRYIKNDPMLVEIEDYLKKLKGSDIKRVSSGKSEFTDTLLDRLENSGFFKEVIYMEAKHSILFSKERYLGAWRSVNDLRVQLGDKNFKAFLNWVENRISKVRDINAIYQTRAWIAKKA